MSEKILDLKTKTKQKDTQQQQQQPTLWRAFGEQIGKSRYGIYIE